MFWIFLTLLPFFLAFFAYHRQKSNKQVHHAWEALLAMGGPTGEGPADSQLPEDLPAPVLRYFKKVLPPDFKRIRQAQLLHEGALNVKPDAKLDCYFSSRSLITNVQPGFIWDAKVHLFRGVHIRVVDSYIRGAGEGRIFLQSAFEMGSDGRHPKINEGALFRYLAEAPWHPTSLLPENGVVWEEMDDRTALARLSAHGMSVALQFRFNDADEIEGIYTQDRYGKFGNHYERHPWEGTFSRYERFHGFLIPTEAEVGWHLPDGWWLFWRATVTAVAYHWEE